MIAAAVFTVRVAHAVVTAGVQVPDTMHWYAFPLAVALTAVAVKHDEVAPGISAHGPVQPAVLTCH